ncbi:MAG: hypothetical protein V1873_01025 [Verrucomicrobiota bacterium]
MKKVVIVAAAVVVFIAAAALFLMQRAGSHPVPAPAAPAAMPAPAREEPPPAEAPAPEPAPASASLPAPAAPTPAPAEAAPVARPPVEGVRRLRGDQVLATVNGVAVLGKDLVAIPPERAAEEITMSPRMYEFLLKRALERELIVQVARAERVELTDAQKQQLAGLRASLEKQDPSVISPAQVDPARVEFDVREVEGLLLRSSLLQKQGHPLPYVTEAEVEKYYQDHRAEYGDLPEDPTERDKAWQEIDLEIRRQLTPELQAEYQAQVEKYLEQLLGAAEIKYPPAAP